MSIISASRRTDIPAFYSEWLFHRMAEGFVLVPNPMNAHQISRVRLTPDVVDCWVFWSKNPAPMLDRLTRFDQPWYLHYTLNAYGEDTECNVPPLEDRLDTFRRIAKLAGPRRTVWRYDPIALGGSYDVSFHLRQFQKLVHALEGCTDTCIISFLDAYDKTRRNAALLRAPGEALLQELTSAMARECLQHGIALQTCAELIDLGKYGIPHGACVDRQRIEDILGCKLTLKPGQQRPACGCCDSIDIGMYDSCRHGCTYCYANRSIARATANVAGHHPHSPLLLGEPTAENLARIKERPMYSCRAAGNQASFWD